MLARVEEARPRNPEMNTDLGWLLPKEGEVGRGSPALRRAHAGSEIPVDTIRASDCCTIRCQGRGVSDASHGVKGVSRATISSARAVYYIELEQLFRDHEQRAAELVLQECGAALFRTRRRYCRLLGVAH